MPAAARARPARGGGRRQLRARALRLQVFPRIGSRPLDSFRPSHIQQLVHALEAGRMAGGYARTIYANVRAVLSSAVDDGYLARNPSRAKSVRLPAA